MAIQKTVELELPRHFLRTNERRRQTEIAKKKQEEHKRRRQRDGAVCLWPEKLGDNGEYKKLQGNAQSVRSRHRHGSNYRFALCHRLKLIGQGMALVACIS